MKFKILMICLVLGVILYISYEYFRTQKFIKIGVELAEKAVAYEQEGSGDGIKVLFVGDSSAVGTGASEPEKSVAGYLGADFSDMEIVNVAVNGYKTEDVVKMLGDSVFDREYDLLVLQIGGNDIVRLVDVDEIEANLRLILDDFVGLADKVVVFHGGNVGTSRLFPWFVRPYYTYRTKQVKDMYTRVVAQYSKVIYVDMFREYSEDPFYLNPEKYYSSDDFHPSGDGYRDWYDLMSGEVSFTK